MNIEEAVNFLVEHAAQVDAKLGAMSSEMATKNELRELREELRNGTRAMRHYVKYVEGLLDRVTKGQLSLEERVEKLEVRVETLENLPPQRAA